MTGPGQDQNCGEMSGGTDTTDSGNGSGNAAGNTSGETSSSSSQMNLNRTPHGPREELFGKRKLQQHIDVRCCNLNVNARPGTTVSRWFLSQSPPVCSLDPADFHMPPAHGRN